MGKETESEIQKAKDDGLIVDLEHGDIVAGGADDGGDDTPPKKEVPVKKERDLTAELDELRLKLSRTEGELAALRTPKQKPAAPAEPDWEELLFTDPKQAVSLLKKTIRDEVVGEVTNSYKKDQGEKDFWNGFYKANDDLKDDDDLVKATLQKHLGELADMPVSKAAERLAELTRERIMRYTGQTPKGGKKAVTEGAGQPTPGRKAPEPQKAVTLSDIIRARRAKRLTKVTTA